MSGRESQLVEPELSVKPRRPSRLRRFLLRHVPLAICGILALLVLVTTGLYFLMSSAQFEGLVRQRLVTELEQFTGGRVEIRSFHWRLLHLDAEADGVVIHGREAAGEAPYASIDRLRVRVSILGLWSPTVKLRDLEIAHPALHLIVYPDGSTNQPHPPKPQSNTHPLDTVFDLQAGHISCEQGVIDLDSRASSFDFQDRHLPLDFQANDLSVVMSYLPGSISTPETYRIEAGATDLNLSSRTARRIAKPVHGYFQASIDLTRSAVTLRSFRLTAQSGDGSSHVLEATGSLQDFTRPRWRAKVAGDLDMRLLDSVTGYPFAPQGIARLDLNGAGETGEFRADGNVHVEGGSYIGTGVVATGVRLDAHVHADQNRLLISSIVARLRQGGQIEGAVDLMPWLVGYPGAAELRAAAPQGGRNANHRNAAPVRPVIPQDVMIPVNGKVTAQFKNVTLDTILDMVSEPPFRRLGIDALLNGPATATWSNGDTATVAVTAKLNMSPSSRPLVGEVPGNGVVDATYTQRNGAVDVRRLELHLPASQLSAHGRLGAYPISSASALAVDFQSSNLGEFDTVLRSLGFQRNGRGGKAALPIAVGGQCEFHGEWTGSLSNPQLGGEMKATQVDIEMPASAAAQGHPSAPPTVHLDSLDASGSYSGTRIAIDHGVLLRGDTRLTVVGSLTAASANPAEAPVRSSRNAPRRASGAPQFDENSALHLRIDASKVSMDDLQPFWGEKLPLSGMLDAQLETDGPVRSLNGSGWVELSNGTFYGEPVKHLRAQGKVANSVLDLSSITLANAAGTVDANGTYDLHSHRFQFEAKGAGIDVAKVDWVRRQDWSAAGKLTFSMRGSGAADDPQLEGNATLSNLALGDEPLGALQLSAHTVNHALAYDMSTRLDGAQFSLHGQTVLKGDYATQARLEFTEFNIDSLLKLAQVKALSGQSALAGTVTLTGPLAHPEQLRGEARLQELEATVAGVHLKSEGGVHAALANERVELDPLHITGEGTDLHLQGTLRLRGEQQLDLAASGSVNLKLAEMIDPDLTAGGTSTFQVEAHGPLKNPGLQGRIDFQNGSLSLGDLPNGLSQLHGTLEFNQDRLEVKSLTAMSGGGPLSVDGYLAYQRGLYADLSVTGKGVRIRYPQGISSLADSTLHLQGTQNNLLLSGDVMITRFSVSPDMDFAALAAQASSAQAVTAPNAASSHIRLDVHILSSPQLNFQNAFAKLAGDVDLRLRGTAATPSLLGRVSITEGTATIAGTRYELQRGDITFSNPVRIEPIIDLSATARVEDYDITLGLHGSPSKPSVMYRSDPPLPESDVVALLALGRTGNEQRLYTQQQEQALSNPTTDALLGGALNATVSSRVQKLFGAGSVKVDPNYLGPFGNSTSRIIVEEQLGRNVTLTYATDVNTTGQQLLQAEIAVNRHVSLLVARDESGVFSMVVKATRRFR